MNKRAGVLLASLVITSAAFAILPAYSQNGGKPPSSGQPAYASRPPLANLEIGAQICGADPLPGETKDEFNSRAERENNTPDWIWDDLDAMQAAPKNMTFTLRQVGNDRVLLANGGIDDNAADRLKTALRNYSPVNEVWFNSPGGNSFVGVQMGDILRQNMVTTRVKAGSGCASACSTAFLGGMMRRVEPGAAYGVHMFTTEISDGTAKAISDQSKGGKSSSQQMYNDIQWLGAKGATERLQYVQRMGVSTHWLDVWSSTRPGCMTFLSQDEMHRFFVNNIE
ncbi:MAG TPA: hypothetical protein VG942_12985 [Hyphomonadaceae bacterium]|nr:hypothetical protein [Hyphomonadaceae bacterium]